MPNYQLNKKWKKVDDATDCPNVFATMSGTSGNYVSDLSGAEIYALLQENPKQMILLKDVNGRDCMLTTPPTSGAATLKFSVLVGTIAYIYTIASGGSAVVASTVDFSSSAGESDIFSFHITSSGGTYSMDTTWADIAAAKQAGKLIVANPGGDYVYYSCGDPTDDGITLSCVYYTSTGAKMRSFTIDTDGVITYNGVTNFTADNVVKYTPQSLSSAQQAQACANIGAANKFVVSFAFIHNAYVCDKTFAAIREAVSNNAVIEAVFGNYSGFLAYLSATEAIFVTTGLPSIPQIFTLKVTSSDVVTADAYSLDNNDGLTDEIKLALLNCIAHVAWDGTDGEDYYTDLYNALFPTVAPTSITAVYTQSGTVYPYYSLDQLKSDLVVTVHYSDSTSATTSAYTLSGTLSVGTSAITVTYSGLTTTFNVTVTASPVPSGYTPIQYVERPTDAAANTCYNSTGFTPNGTDDLEVKMTVELLAAPSSSSGGYFLACRQNNSGNTLGFGIYVPQAATSIGTFDGESCMIEPEGAGVSIIGKKYSLTVTKTPTTITVTDGTHTNTITRTPRAMANALSVFGLISTTSQLNVPIYGRIHELEITEGTTLKVKFIPCKRNNDNAVGFWNPVSSEFKTAAYTAGPVL